MDNDKLFTAYTLVIIAALASVITASVLAGTASLPTPLVFLEHIGLSLLFRTAYKSFDGTYWVNNIHIDSVEEAEEATAGLGVGAGI